MWLCQRCLPGTAPSRAGGQHGVGCLQAAAVMRSPTPLAGSPFCTGARLLRAPPQGRRARGRELPGWEGSGRQRTVPLPWLRARTWWSESQHLNPSRSERRELGCRPQCSSFGILLAAGALGGAAFPCALVHRGMRRGDKGLVRSQRPGKTARLPAGYRLPQLHPPW